MCISIRHISSLAPLFFLMSSTLAADSSQYTRISVITTRYCGECHNADNQDERLDFSSLKWDLDNPVVFNQWEMVFDKVASLQMPPNKEAISEAVRHEFINLLGNTLRERDRQQIKSYGRGTIRRLTRSEFQQNLRDLLQISHLDIQNYLPADRESHHTNRITRTLDISRVQLAAYLEATDAALRQAVASGVAPETPAKYHFEAINMFTGATTFGGTEAMFYAKDNKRLSLGTPELQKIRQQEPLDTSIELAIFRSATWPYYGYPNGFRATRDGFYRVRFSARSVLQKPGFVLTPASDPIPMTFRARKASGPDVTGDVRATGGIMDIPPEPTIFETTIYLKKTETFEYSLLGLPQPRAINPPNAPLYYDFPPMPEDGHPGVSYQWLEVEGPIDSSVWPPASHKVLFDELPIKPSGSSLTVDIVSENPQADARRLLLRFIKQAQRRPLTKAELKPFLDLTINELETGQTLSEALLTGYSAFLSSGHFIYTIDPTSLIRAPQTEYQLALAQQLSHFLSNSRPSQTLEILAANKDLLKANNLRSQTDELIRANSFNQFLRPFTYHWLDLKAVWRDEPDIRLYPEYRLNDYLIESMQREAYETFKLMVRENLPITTLVDADFVLINDILSRHYNLPLQKGSELQRITVPKGSPYGGLLTTGAIMKVTANGTASSPIVRGAWVMDRLLGAPPPPPPANIPAAEPDIRGATTLKEQLAKHASDQSCASCHATFDPIGFSLENFDIYGKWRERYRSLDSGEEVTGIDRAGHAYRFFEGSAVDSTATLNNGTRLAGIHDLKQHLVQQPRNLARSLATQLVLYATGTPLRFSEREDIEDILDQCHGQGYLTRDIFHAVIQSRLFTGVERD
ncbi:MAG: hypothetical protein CMJ76_13350 [Planctomycetaceae bacterium]|nr:hypothetical protein [Planctomycetaceae bacterium]|tara:strand:- start:433 stop:3015 length:2583 start_codon:yes stop_codon:yes gene_type:complete